MTAHDFTLFKMFHTFPGALQVKNSASCGEYESLGARNNGPALAATKQAKDDKDGECCKSGRFTP